MGQGSRIDHVGLSSGEGTLEMRVAASPHITCLRLEAGRFVSGPVSHLTTPPKPMPIDPAPADAKRYASFLPVISKIGSLAHIEDK
jgi:hypothetical protein